MTITLNSRADFTLEAARRVAWGGEGVVLGEASQRAMTEARTRFLCLIEEPEVIIYGVTSGYGQNAKVRLAPEERKAHADRPPLAPAASWGDPITIDDELKVMVNFGTEAGNGKEIYGHGNYAEKRVEGGFFFRNPNTRGAVFSGDSGATLLIGDMLQAAGGAVGQVVHPGLLLKLQHGRYRFFQVLSGGDRAVPLHQDRFVAAHQGGQVHPFFVGLDGLDVGINLQRVADQRRAFLAHRHDGHAQNAEEHGVPGVDVDHRVHLGLGFVDAGVNLYLGTLG